MQTKCKNFYKSYWHHISTLPSKDMDTLHQSLIESISVSLSNKILNFTKPLVLYYSLQILTNKLFLPVSFRLGTELGNHLEHETERLEFAFSTAKNIFQSLGWSNAWSNVNEITRIVYPSHFASIPRWKTIMLGTEINSKKIEIRLYLGLPKKNIPLAWTQIEKVLTIYFSQQNVKRYISELKKLVKNYMGVPAVLALVLRQNLIVGLRVYFLIEKNAPSFEWLSKMFNYNDAQVDKILSNIYTRFHEIGYVTAYDFEINGDYNQDLDIGRFKVETYLGNNIESGELVLKWITEIFPSASSEIQSFNTRLKDCFNNFTIDYLAIGIKRNKDIQIACYAYPELSLK